MEIHGGHTDITNNKFLSKEEEEMNFLLKSAVPMLVDIVADMITPEGVTEFRKEVITMLEKAATSSDLALDDKALEVFISTIMTEENCEQFGAGMVNIMKEYVRNSETKYDDWVIPILDSLLEAFSVEKV